MRLTAATIANTVAAAVLVGMAVLAAGFAAVLGPAGLIVLGLLDLFVCSRFSLDEDAPSWGTAEFAARLYEASSPEMRAAAQAIKQARWAKLRFYRRCGIVLVVAGAAGIAWQVYHGK